VLRKQLEALGWSLEQDWHVWVGLSLEIAGFAVLSHHPPLTALALALWIAGGVILLDRREPPLDLLQDSGEQVESAQPMFASGFERHSSHSNPEKKSNGRKKAALVAAAFVAFAVLFVKMTFPANSIFQDFERQIVFSTSSMFQHFESRVAGLAGSVLARQPAPLPAPPMRSLKPWLQPPSGPRSTRNQLLRLRPPAEAPAATANAAGGSPGGGEPVFQWEVLDLANQRWLATPYSERMVPVEEPQVRAGSGALPSSEDEHADSNGFEPAIPAYAPLNLAHQKIVRGAVVLRVVIDKQGGVKDVQAISSPSPSLAATVVQAVRRWRYQPFYWNRQAVEAATRLSIDFTAPTPSTRNGNRD
jgi:TonB family protein